MSLKQLFIEEVNHEIQKHSSPDIGLLAEADILHLPPPVQKYFRYCGYLARPKIINAQIVWRDVYLKLSLAKKWQGIRCFQFNAVPEPARFAFMTSKIAGLIPFEGRDKFQDGHGNMLIKLFRVFTMGNAKGREMDESALVTVLAEALFVPGYALQPYISWEPIDDLSARATIEDNGIKVSGVFFFNEKGETIRFETEDRSFTEKNRGYKKCKWTAMMENYQAINGILTPTTIRAMWNLPKGDFEYYKGIVDEVRFNIPTLVINH